MLAKTTWFSMDHTSTNTTNYHHRFNSVQNSSRENLFKPIPQYFRCIRLFVHWLSLPMTSVTCPIVNGRCSRNVLWEKDRSKKKKTAIELFMSVRSTVRVPQSMPTPIMMIMALALAGGGGARPIGGFLLCVCFMSFLARFGQFLPSS